MDLTAARNLITSHPWHHDFEIIPGIWTNGSYNPKHLLDQLNLPDDLSGARVADIGASNGFFSFELKKRGAEVAAFDYRHKDNSGFGLAQYINGINDIEHYQTNVLDISEKKYGQFDIVLALGLFYHVSDPYLALSNCASLSKGQLFIESYCIDALLDNGLAQQPIMKFIRDVERFPESKGVNNDRSNFWGFTSTCLLQMTEDVGFKINSCNIFAERVFISSSIDIANREKLRLNLAHQTPPTVPKNNDELNDPKAWIIF